MRGMGGQHPFLDPSHNQGSRNATEAAQRAQEAAGVIGQDRVNREMIEAARAGERAEIERAHQLAGEAAHVRAMHEQQSAGYAPRPSAAPAPATPSKGYGPTQRTAVSPQPSRVTTSAATPLRRPTPKWKDRERLPVGFTMTYLLVAAVLAIALQMTSGIIFFLVLLVSIVWALLTPAWYLFCLLILWDISP